MNDKDNKANKVVSDEQKIPLPTSEEKSDSLGEIKINHSVIASIVRLASQEVEGVHSVGGGIVEGLAEMFSKKDSERGVKVSENEVGDYVIEVRVTLLFGYELAKIGLSIQQNVSSKVARMTMKNVEKVNVVIDGVKPPSPQEEKQEDSQEEQ